MPPIVGENSVGMCAAWRAFHASTSHQILDDLCPKGAACSRFLLRGLSAPVLNFALVESHGRASMSGRRTSLKGGMVDKCRPKYLVEEKNHGGRIGRGKI